MTQNKKSIILVLGMVLSLVLSVSSFAQRGQPYVHGDLKITDYFTPSTPEALTPDAEGFIGRWLLLEPITKPNRSNTVFVDSYLREVFYKEYFPGQFTVLPKDGDKVTVEKEPEVPFVFPGQEPAPAPKKTKIEKEKLTWHALDSKLYNVKLFRFASGLKKSVYGVLFWAVTVINAPEDMEVRMSVGSNSASMWWVNGSEVLLLSGDRRMVVDDMVSKRITLKKGKNIVRGAVINGPGMSDFCVRFLDSEGKPVTNLTITNE